MQNFYLVTAFWVPKNYERNADLFNFVISFPKHVKVGIDNLTIAEKAKYLGERIAQEDCIVEVKGVKIIEGVFLDHETVSEYHRISVHRDHKVLIQSED